MPLPHSLTSIRKLLAVQDVQRALELIQVGLAKSVTAPYQLVDTDTDFPEINGFRAIGKLLPSLIGYEFSVGNPSGALDGIELGIRFAHSIQQKMALTSIIAIICETILLARCSERIEPLSKRDCTRLLQILTDRIELPQNYPDILRAEYEYSVRILLKAHDDDKLRSEALSEAQPNEPSEQIVNEGLRNNPEAAKRSIMEAIDQLDQIYERAIQIASMPPWKRPAAKEQSDPSAEAKYWLSIRTTSAERTQSRFDYVNAQYRIFATLVLLRRYRWEHDSYPESLAAFEEKNLIEDPFSGKPLVYARKGAGFELHSIGDFSYDENNIRGKARAPIYLPRRD